MLFGASDDDCGAPPDDQPSPAAVPTLKPLAKVAPLVLQPSYPAGDAWWRDTLATVPGRVRKDGTRAPGAVRLCPGNVEIILTCHESWRDRLAFDERQCGPVWLQEPPFLAHHRAGSVEPCPRAVTDEDAIRVRAWLEATEGLGVRREDVKDGLIIAAQRTPFDPVRRFLDGLAWDGVSRIDTWLTDYLGATDTPFVRAVGARWLISAVARTFTPGCKVDTVLVLEGPQGAGKSRALRALVPEARWHADELGDIRSKEGPLSIAGKWVIELAELAALGRPEIEATKAFLSRGVDHFRGLYASGPKDHARRCVFAASTNSSAYLKDETGARRFWPVTVGAILVDELTRDRGQLWAETRDRYIGGERWWLHEAALVSDAAEAAETRFAADAWEHTIAEWLDKPAQAAVVEVTITDVLREVLGLPLAHHDQISQVRAGRALARLKWTLSQPRRNGRRVRVYLRPVPGNGNSSFQLASGTGGVGFGTGENPTK